MLSRSVLGSRTVTDITSTMSVGMSTKRCLKTAVTAVAVPNAASRFWPSESSSTTELLSILIRTATSTGTAWASPVAADISTTALSTHTGTMPLAPGSCNSTVRLVPWVPMRRTIANPATVTSGCSWTWATFCPKSHSRMEKSSRWDSSKYRRSSAL